MSNWILTLLATCAIYTLSAQDLIVTSKGDSLNCRVTKTSSTHTWFTFKYEGEIRNTLLPNNQILSLKKNFYTRPEVTQREIRPAAPEPDKIRFGVSGGLSYLSAPISTSTPRQFHPYYKDLRSGSHLGLDFTWFTSPSVGFGLRGSRFTTSNSVQIYAVDSAGQYSYGNLSDDITVSYLGPSVVTRMASKNGMRQFTMGLSVGYMFYRNNAQLIDAFTLTSETVGVTFEMGLDFRLDRNLMLGFALNSTGGSLSYFNITEGGSTRKITLEPGSFESLRRIDLSIALRFSL